MQINYNLIEYKPYTQFLLKNTNRSVKIIILNFSVDDR